MNLSQTSPSGPRTRPPPARRLSTASTTSTVSSTSSSKQDPDTYGFRSTTTQAPPSYRSSSVEFTLPPSSFDHTRSSRPHADRTVPVARGIETEKNCDRRRPEEEDRSRLVAMSPQLVAKTLTPFLRDHIPGTYAPLAKPITGEGVVRDERSNSKFCYRHRPDILCRRAADETKMVMIQSELDRLPPDDRQAITHVWSLFSAAPSKHRDLMLQGIMTQCCFPQLSTVAREVQDQLKIDFIAALPNELSYKILGYLDAVSLCRAAAVSRQWRELAEDDQVWHRICEQHIDRKCTKCGWGLPLLEQKRLREWTRRKQRNKELTEGEPKPRVPETQPMIAAPNTPKSPPSPKRELEDGEGSIAKRRKARQSDVEVEREEQRGKQWKKLYRERFKVGSNWKYGRCKFRTFKGHQNGVTCLQLDDSILASGSYDSTIKIWNIETGEEMRTLRGHTGGIRTLQFDDNILISGSLDNTVKVWNWHTGELINSLQCHTDGVISVNFEGSWLATGSIDKTVRVFNFETRESFCLRGHEDWVNQVRICLASRTVLSASDDCTVKMWDLDSKQCLRTFTGHIGHVQQVLPLPPDFEPDDEWAADAMSVASGRGGTPLPNAVPAFITKPSNHTVTPGSPPLEREEDIRAAYGATFQLDSARPLPSRYMLTGSLDSTVGLWDTATGRCLKKWFGHLEGIWGLVGDTLRVVTGAQDGAVKVWEPRAGKCERTFTGPRGPVTCVGLSDSRMASGSEDGEVRVYSFHDMAGLEELGTPS